LDLIRRIEAGQGGFLVFALTPPRLATDREQVQDIADTTIARLLPLDLDGLILYDIDDETERNAAERPFPFMPTLDPAHYLAEHLAAWPAPVVVYRAVSKYAPAELRSWLSAQDPTRVMTVLVGAPSSATAGRTSLADAQALRRDTNPALSLGGVAIPERHTRREDEHLRLLAKQEAGCRFFVTQVVYDINAAKSLVSDYHYECQARGVPPAPFVFTFSVCGSMKTLEFLRWLGVDVPRWIENDLAHATDPLEASYEQALTTATELMAYCRTLGVPLGSTSRACRFGGSRSKRRCASPSSCERTCTSYSPEMTSPTASRRSSDARWTSGPSQGGRFQELLPSWLPTRRFCADFAPSAYPPERRKPRDLQGFREIAGAGFEPATFGL
jgi:hypothetical protein